MKSLRRSLNNNNNHSTSSTPQPSPPLPNVIGGGGAGAGPGGGAYPLGRPSEKVAPPQKVIKALSSHRSTNPQELSYTKGDFWYVTSERDVWYEALNPITGARGLVPKSEFEEFVKGGRHPSGQRSIDNGRPYTPSQGHLSQHSQQSDPRSPPGSSISPPITSEPPRRPKQPVYAIVQYDFQAERPDELDAKKGEPIVVIAQSNHEWFVAKPIGRLGGPGLIPVAFVEIRDPATGKPIEMLPNTIPLVEEWKKATADYKAAAIPLGRFDLPPDQVVSNSPYAPTQGSSAAASQSSLNRTTSTTSVSQLNGRTSQPISALPPAAAAIPTQPFYRPEQDLMLPPGNLTALSVPSFHNESGNYWFRLHVTFVPEEPSAPAYTLSLYRTYEDFYDFQITLLDTFPYEAGRPRPGEEDRSPPERILPYMPGPVDDEIDDELTEYRREELDAYVRALVDLRERQAGYILQHELFRTFFAAKYGDYCEEIAREDVVGELEERLAEVRVSDHPQQYQVQDPRSQSVASRHSQKSSNQDRYSPQPWGHQPASHSMSSRGPSPLPPIETQSSSRPDSSGYPATGRQSAGGAGHYTSGGPSTATSSSSWGGAANPSPATTVPTPNPVQSSQPPYIKIKIYDRSTDDLIAIRVHPSVSHSELFEKVRARLGSNVHALRYRTSMDGSGQGYRELRDDRELREWMSTEDQKLVLYAEQG
ncbi:hypothetical protein CI109_106907 [Kwoniella shandongensis]|uniref:Uncharacterized protein n=1 Tax=Kwoniella shandongensis TaxID=1734106 RepID=A0A5M6C6C3_9TREE|nr:uncharacterized protein CI109_000838 [Kwoniella shandongensis]KAA5530658.1 hypothetical protein CI109_000838 [Kwoniella shandongensis]